MEPDNKFVKDLRKVSSDNGIELTSRKFAELMDTQKVALSQLRQQFHYPIMKTLPKVDIDLVNPNEDSIYLCGHSLGLQPKGVKKYLDRELEKWAQMGVYGHTLGDCPWMLCDEHCTKSTAKIVGAKTEEVGVMNALTVNLHLLMVSFYRPTASRHKILLESQSFPSDHYAIESQIKFHGFDPQTSMICMKPREGETCLRTEDILKMIDNEGDSIALVLFGGVQYYTGQLFDISDITKIAQNKGCVVGWDMAHAVGNVPLSLHDWGVDFAVWCSYKYMNSGAGGIGGMFIHEKHAKNEYSKFLGWWGHKLETRFQMDNVLDLSEGPAGYRTSNPSMLQVCSMLASLDVFDMTSMQELREKSLLLTTYMHILIMNFLGQDSAHRNTQGYCSVVTPSDPYNRGCQLSVQIHTVHDLGVIYSMLNARGVVCDRRHSVLRVAPIPLYNSFLDVHRFVSELVTVLKNVESGEAQSSANDGPKF